MSTTESCNKNKYPFFTRAILLPLATLFAFGMNNANAANTTDFTLGIHNICAIDTDGRLECTTNESPQTFLPPDNGARYTQVSSGGAHNCAITTTGEIVCWGQNFLGQLDAPVSTVPFVAVSSSEGHSCAIDANGQVACWGLNSNGQTDVPQDNNDFVAIYTGTSGSCGTKSSGTTLCWSDTTPYVTIDGRENIIDLQLPQRTDDLACYLESDGAINCTFNVLELGIPNNGPYTKIAGNRSIFCGLKPDGDLDCNLRATSSVNSNNNLATLAAINALPPLSDIEIRLAGRGNTANIHFCGVGVDGQLHCAGALLPANDLPGEQIALPVPTALSFNVYGDNLGELFWEIDTSGIDNGNRGQYRIYRNDELVSQSFANSSYLDTDFEVGVELRYEVAFLSIEGIEGPRSEPLLINGEFSNDNNDEQDTPSTNTLLSELTVSRYGENSLELFWTPPTHSEPTRRYDIYRNTELVTSVPGPSYFDDQLDATTAYQYSIIAVSNTGVIQAIGLINVEPHDALVCFQVR